MKKLYIAALSLFIAYGTNAQNVILSEDFEFNIISETDLNDIGNNTTWVNADWDGLPYTGTAGQRDGYWFTGPGFADADVTTVMMSNSWTDNTTPVANYLILPPIHFTAADGMFYWKSATFQTPRFLDGLQILVSTTGNLPEHFTDTLRLYAEYISGEATDTDTTFANFTFSNGYVMGAHPEDYAYLEYHDDSLRFIGILRPDSASLAAYANQTIYLAICHGTTDDNLIAVDDILVTGTGIIAGIESEANAINGLSLYPNPASDIFRISYQMETTGRVNVNVFDITGKLVKPVSNSTQIRGAYAFDVSTKDLANGQYNVVLQTEKGTSAAKVTVQH